MRRILFVFTTMLSLLSLLPTKSVAQSLNVVNMECVGSRGFAIDDYHDVEITIYDDGGPNHGYCKNGHSTLRIFSVLGLELELEGSYFLGEGDTLYVYENSNEQGNIRRVCTGTGVLYVRLRDAVFLEFNTDDTIEGVGFELHLTHCVGTSRMIYDIRDSVSNGRVYLHWCDTSSREMWRVLSGSDPSHLTDTLFTDTTAAMLYVREYGNLYYCIYNSDLGDICDRGTDMRKLCVELPGSTLCSYFTDFYNCNVTGYYGHTSNPYCNVGVENYGDSIASRLTIIDDYTRRDPRTGNGLTMVPAGFTRSVRLGNWNTHGEAEAITYDYQVDTTLSDLLILHFAAVMQNPNHQPNEQPRFRFEILDEDGIPLNADCYSTDFVASNNLGWNTYDDGNADHVLVLWKDWTEVALNLAPLHGRNIKIRLTTYDCVQGSHYGYAYFAFECGQKKITSSSCQGGSSIFTAPAGLRYRWYSASLADSTLSSSRTFSTMQAGTYYCEMHSPQDSLGHCSFTMKAVSGSRHIVAGMRTMAMDTSACQVSLLFVDTSRVLLDEGNTVTGMATELRQWIVDGAYRGEATGCLAVLDTGWHTVMLVVSIAEGRCADTLVSEFYIVLPCVERTVIRAKICDDDAYNYHGTHYNHAVIAYFDSADVHEQLILQHYYGDIVRITVNMNVESLPFLFQGNSYWCATTDTFSFQNRLGCDSLVILQIALKNMGLKDTAVCDDAFPLLWHGVLFRPDSATLQQDNLVLCDTVLEVIPAVSGGDSLTVLCVRVMKSSHLATRMAICEGDSYLWLANGNSYESAANDTLRYTRQNGCDSLLVLQLIITPAPTARIDAPGWTDVDHLMITLKNISEGGRGIWHLPNGAISEEQQLHYLYPTDEDSVTISLDVFADGGCYDSDTAVVHLDRHGLWVPNAITPQHATNQRFIVKGRDLAFVEVYIFGHHGEQLCYWQGQDGHWDATYRGEYVPQAVYAYLVRYSTRRHPDAIKERVGTVLVIY